GLRGASGGELWAYNAGLANYVVSSPAVAGGTVYVGSAGNRFYALSAATGAKRWSYATGQPISSAPAVANGVVYAGGDGGTVFAFRAATGAKLWSHPLGAAAPSPAGVNGRGHRGPPDPHAYAVGLSVSPR